MTNFGAGRCHAHVFCDPEGPPTDGRWVVLVKADFADLKQRAVPAGLSFDLAGPRH